MTFSSSIIIIISCFSEVTKVTKKKLTLIFCDISLFKKILLKKYGDFFFFFEEKKIFEENADYIKNYPNVN